MRGNEAAIPLLTIALDLWCLAIDIFIEFNDNHPEIDHWAGSAKSKNDNTGTWIQHWEKQASGWTMSAKVTLPGLGPQGVARVTDIYPCLTDKFCVIGGHALGVFDGSEFEWSVDGPDGFSSIYHPFAGGGRPWVFAKDDIWWGPAHWDGKAWTTEELPKSYPKAELNPQLDKFSKVYIGPRHLGTYWTGKDLLIVMEDGVYRRKTPPK